jgi:hypothetical protein
MPPDPKADELVDCIADERLLAEDLPNLPMAVGRPEMLPPSGIRGRLVGLGATLTGVTLIAGIALIALGAIHWLTSGVDLAGILALIVGVGLAGTHWGWVHVAEATADAIEGRRNAEVRARRQQWLETIEPYTRYEVTTSVGDDGSITINRVRHRPVRTGERGFTFVREIERTETHSGDEPAAAITERAELLRREAAAATELERGRFEVAADAYETEALDHGDERQRREARRAASAALSQQINSNLRDPPVIE